MSGSWERPSVVWVVFRKQNRPVIFSATSQGRLCWTFQETVREYRHHQFGQMLGPQGP